MFMKAFTDRSLRGGTRRHRLLATLLAMAAVGCGPRKEPVEPELPGSIVLATETSGFLQDDSYELFVGGESRGTIQANGEMTISGLDPATYDVTLGDVADNCSAESASIELASDETANVSLSVRCSFANPDSYTIRFSRERPNLDSGEITTCQFGLCPTSEGWDVWAYDNGSSTPRAIIRPNQTTGVEIAHLVGVVFEELTEADVAGAEFTTERVEIPFDAWRVVLVRTDTGTLFALGNPAEDLTALTLTFDAAVISQP